MAMTKLLSAVAVALATPLVQGSEFLRSKTAGELEQAMKESLKSSLMAELSTDSARLRDLEDQLRPMFSALPKNEQGKLESPAVRYALHRYFVRTHGWYVVGLDPLGQAWNSTVPTDAAQGRVPAFILGLFEERLKGKGMGLHDLAAFAATLLDFVYNDAIADVMDIYKAMKLEPTSSLTAFQADRLVQAIMLMILDGNVTVKEDADIDRMARDMEQWFPHYHDFMMWVRDTRHTTARERRQSHLMVDDLSLDNVVADVTALTDRLFKFQDVECRSMKTGLANLEYKGTGRVLLSDFYKAGLRGDFLFVEHTDYLRRMGALDETDPSHPTVIISNFLTSTGNCLTESSFHSVCCLDECQGLLGHLEESIAAPTATPTRIAELVAAMPSDTVDAPRNLSATMLSRLGDIADHHDGNVPLHSRLFAQWLHHAYPLECPFPHVAGTTRPLTQDEWMHLTGAEDVTHSEEERVRISKLRPAEDVTLEVPWMHVEELVVQNRHQSRRSRSVASKGAGFAAVVAMAASIAVYAARAVMPAPVNKVEKFMV